MDAGGVSPPIHIPGLCRVLLDAAVREHRPRDRGCDETRGRTCVTVALSPRAPTWSSFPASKVVPSFRAHTAAGNRPPALGLRRPMVPRDRAAIPRVVRARRCRQTPERDGRHSPGQRARWPPSPGPRRWPPSTRREAHSFKCPRTSRIGDSRNLCRRRRSPRRLCRRTRGQGLSARRGDLGLLGTGVSVYGPARIAAPALSGPSPSRGDAALVSLDRAAA
jgi:hypothetical protein